MTDWGSLNLKVENHRYYPTELINENLDSEYYMKKLDIYQLGFSLLEIIGVPIERLKKIFFFLFFFRMNVTSVKMGKNEIFNKFNNLHE